MIKFYVIGQTIRYATPNLAADSFNYLEAEFAFEGETWDGYSKWAHFRQGDTEYSLELADDHITSEMGLNLTIGEWEVFLTGIKETSRITTVPVIISVYESGLINAPLGEMPPTVAEQIAVRADTALRMAQTVLEAAEKGQFDGKDGKGVNVYEEYFDTLEALREGVTIPESGMLYGVGTEPPLNFYGWDAVNSEFILVGPIQGAEGPEGKQGVTFTPLVDASGNLSWTNDGGRENPATVNIRGPQGIQGEPGAEGKGPYEFAQEGGYTGTEKTLMDALVYLPQHHTRHEAGGLDPISITAEMIPAGAVTKHFIATIPASGWTGDAAPYTNTVAVPGMLAEDRPHYDIICNANYDTAMQEEDEWDYVYNLIAAANSVTLYAKEKATIDYQVQMEVHRK